MKSLYITFLLFVAYVNFSYSCDCKEGFSEFTPVYLSEYNHIKICQPFSADTVDQTIYYRVLVQKNYWGINEDTITVATHYMSGTCGYPLKLNTSYLLYGKGSDAIFYISVCSPQREILTTSSLSDYANNTDSIMTSINFVKKYYTWKYLTAFDEKSHKNEMAILEKLLVSTDTITSYFVDGTVSGKFLVKDGKLNGPSQFYYPNGLLYSKGNFISGKKEAVWNEYLYKIKRKKEFYVQETGTYKEGMKRGAWKGKMLKGTLEEYSVGIMNFKLDQEYDK